MSFSFASRTIWCVGRFPAIGVVIAAVGITTRRGRE
jgi:hypothetical protein